MIEKALSGSKTLLGLGQPCCCSSSASASPRAVYQYFSGLGVTGLSRDVPWGFYIAQFTFLVGVAASRGDGGDPLLPAQLQDVRQDGRAGRVPGHRRGARCACSSSSWTWGSPTRVMNMLLHPTPNSLMFWDMVVLLWLPDPERRDHLGHLRGGAKGIAPPKWIKPFIYLSIPWAVSIHTVTAFLYSGLAARPFWMTAILAPRFLASAFAAGPALLILLCLPPAPVRRLRRGQGGAAEAGARS